MLFLIINPANRTDVARFFPFVKGIWLKIIEFFLWFWPATRLSKIKPIDRDEIIGEMIAVTVTPRMINSQRLHWYAARKIVAGVKKAKRAGATVVVLTGHTGKGELGEAIIRHCQTIPELAELVIATGNTYTAVAICGGTIKKIHDNGRQTSDCVLAIIGPYGSIGDAVTEMLAKHTWKRIILVGNKLQQTNQVKQRICKQFGIDPETVEARIRQTDFTEADVVVTACSNEESFLGPQAFKQGAIICDAAVPSAVHEDVPLRRPDLTLFIGGAVIPKTPEGDLINFGFNFGMPPNYCYACMGEGLILYFSGEHDLATKTKRVSRKNARRYAEIANQYNFVPVELARRPEPASKTARLKRFFKKTRGWLIQQKSPRHS